MFFVVVVVVLAQNIPVEFIFKMWSASIYLQS